MSASIFASQIISNLRRILLLFIIIFQIIFPFYACAASTQKPHASGSAFSIDSKNGDDGEILLGHFRSSSEYLSGWLDLKQPVDLNKGDRLEIMIAGEAKKCLLRLLPDGEDPDGPSGLIRMTFEVPNDSSRPLVVTLQESRAQITQISAHGGPKPFSRNLGAGNGAARVTEVKLIRAKTTPKRS